MKETWQEKSKDKPSSPEVLGLEYGCSCHDAARGIRLAWRLSVCTRRLSHLYKR